MKSRISEVTKCPGKLKSAYKKETFLKKQGLTDKSNSGKRKKMRQKKRSKPGTAKKTLAICKRHPLRSGSSSWILDKSSSVYEGPVPCEVRVEASNLGVRHSLFCHSNWGT